MSAEKKVVTITGEKVPISQCRQFSKSWYKIGDLNIKDSGDCYLINGKYYREETKLIVYNYSINKYIMNDNKLILGIVDIVDEIVTMGHFDNKNYSTVTVKNKCSYPLLNAKLLENNKQYRECFSDGNFYHIDTIQAKKLNIIKTPYQDYKNSLPYDSKGIIEQNLINYKNNYNPEILPYIKRYSPLLGNLTFGLEFETTKGFIPSRILDEYGLIPLRDGSISGIEYVTVPMNGEKGLQCSFDILSCLKKRTEYEDKSCSLHLHLGNMPRTKEFILSFFKLGMFVQDEMFEMFPIYKKYNFGIKNKNYSAPLPTFEILSQLDNVINSENIDRNFNVLYKLLSMGEGFEEKGYSLENVHYHPADPGGKQKWNIRSRYYLFNLIPLIFGNKQTIEFRIHTPTYDENKILPFILMNSMLVNFAIRNESDILKNKKFFNNFSLYQILSNEIDFVKPEKIQEIRNMFDEYINVRKNGSESQTRRGDVLGTESKIGIQKKIKWASKTESETKFSSGLVNKINSYSYDASQLETNTASYDSLKSKDPDALIDHFIRLSHSLKFTDAKSTLTKIDSNDTILYK